MLIALFALFAAFYQLHLQRVHNEKSLKPLVQINVMDRQRVICVNIRNNGVGPFIIKKLTFIKDDRQYSEIEDCLTLNPLSYQHVTTSEIIHSVIQPGSFLELFATEFENSDTAEYINDVREQLSALQLIVDGVDIYDNKVATGRNLQWFSQKKNINAIL